MQCNSIINFQHSNTEKSVILTFTNEQCAKSYYSRNLLSVNWCPTLIRFVLFSNNVHTQLFFSCGWSTSSGVFLFEFRIVPKLRYFATLFWIDLIYGDSRLNPDPKYLWAVTMMKKKVSKILVSIYFSTIKSCSSVVSRDIVYVALTWLSFSSTWSHIKILHGSKFYRY